MFSLALDTPDLSLLISSFLEKENCDALINNYVFINGVEFGAYYFVLAMSLIVALSVFLNPIHNENCSDNSVSIKGWTEIYNFLTGQFLSATPIEEEVPMSNIPLDDVSSCSSDQESPHEILQSIRLKNVDRIIIGHLNINSIRNKIQLLNDIVQDKID